MFRHGRVSWLVDAILITLGLVIEFVLVVSMWLSLLLSPLSGQVVQEEALSAVTSAPELRNNKT